jgi:hypothetical protein
VEDRPGGAKPIDALINAGVLRGLCALLPTCAAQPAAEPLRVALLLCAAASPTARHWVLEVPDVGQLLRPYIAVHGASTEPSAAALPLHPHRIVWALLAQQGGGAAGSSSTSAAEQLLAPLLQAATAAAATVPQVRPADCIFNFCVQFFSPHAASCWPQACSSCLFLLHNSSLSVTQYVRS